MERLVLIGFMGCGKTTLGPRLAARAGVAFVDLDVRLEIEAGASIRELMRRDGEAEFRRLELEALQRLVVSAPARCVIATGGGIVETEAAQPLLKALGPVVWLQAEPRVSVSRLRGARAGRPLLDAGLDWMARWERREPLYRALADYVVSTHPQSVEESLAQLEGLLGPRPVAG